MAKVANQYRVSETENGTNGANMISQEKAMNALILMRDFDEFIDRILDNDEIFFYLKTSGVIEEASRVQKDSSFIHKTGFWLIIPPNKELAWSIKFSPVYFDRLLNEGAGVVKFDLIELLEEAGLL